MSWKSRAAIAVLAVTTAFGQENAPAGTPAAGASQPLRRPMPTRRWGSNPAGFGQAGPVNAPPLERRVQDLEETVNRMNALLSEMRKKTALSAKDSMANANLQMWELMVGQLDKQLKDLKLAEASRVAMEARRASLYKQADMKAQAAARAAQQEMSSQQPNGSVTSPEPDQGAAAPVPAQVQIPAADPAADASRSPSTSSLPH